MMPYKCSKPEPWYLWIWLQRQIKQNGDVNPRKLFNTVVLKKSIFEDSCCGILFKLYFYQASILGYRFRPPGYESFNRIRIKAHPYCRFMLIRIHLTEENFLKYTNLKRINSIPNWLGHWSVTELPQPVSTNVLLKLTVTCYFNMTSSLRSMFGCWPAEISPFRAGVTAPLDEISLAEVGQHRGIRLSVLFSRR